MEENARIAQNQDEYNKQFETLVKRYETAKARLEKIADEKQDRLVKRESISRFITELGRSDGLLDDFDEGLWYAMVESVTVHFEKEVAVTFKDGSEIRVALNK